MVEDKMSNEWCSVPQALQPKSLYVILLNSLIQAFFLWIKKAVKSESVSASFYSEIGFKVPLIISLSDWIQTSSLFCYQTIFSEVKSYALFSLSHAEM